MKEKVFSLLLALLLCVGSAAPALAADLTRVSRVDANGNVKYGFADSNGNIIIAEQYDDAEEFRGRYAKVKQNGRWGIISEEGWVHIPIQYADVRYYEDLGRAEIQNSQGLWGVYSPLGGEIVRPQYEQVKILHLPELTRIFGTVVMSKSSEGKKWGLVGGVKDIPCTNDGSFGVHFRSYDEHIAMAVVERNEKQGIWLGYQTEDGGDIVEILSPQYSSVELNSICIRTDSTLPEQVSYSAIVGQYDPASETTAYGYLVDGELQKPIQYTREEIDSMVTPGFDRVRHSSLNDDNLGGAMMVSSIAAIMLLIVGGVVFVKIKEKGKNGT